ncbi:GMC family oxidoreductase [Endozoicomonas ascidiicola]|uniref:GMC family oxidoreductase n=1 Tax=Endozoicomonas ascidiicola TaxID=1698521 RepID=UPI00082E6B22|nr:GMC family oxidoreductase N-terminal domain-containing protein [Endozoicomonas ascidiicola]
MIPQRSIKYLCIHLLVLCFFQNSAQAFLSAGSQIPLRYSYDALDEEEFDYIIVGAGSAGSVIARRLAQHKDFKILLLEAGKQPPFRSWIPAAAATLQKTDHDWGYQTEPQTHSHFGFKQQRSFWPRGKMLGGSSGLNYMLYVRGHRADFDRWSQCNGCEDWAYGNVLQWFLTSEKNQDELLANSPFHNTSGEMTVSLPGQHKPIPEAFIKACQEASYLHLPDYNGALMNNGCGLAQAHINNGWRESTKSAFLDKAVLSPHVKLITNAYAKQIIFSSDDLENKRPRAKGVIYSRENIQSKVYARNEVIVSAGAIESPKLLMLSGIGPSDHLKAMGIPVVKDLPVGNNLQDHLMVPIPYSVNQPTLSERDDNWLSIFNFLIGSDKHLQTNLAEAIGFFHTAEKPPESAPDIYAFMVATSGTSKDFINFNTDPEKLPLLKGISKAEQKQGILRNYVYLLPSLAHPKSRGTLRLNPANPEGKPLIDPNYLSNPNDLECLLKGVRIIETIAETQAWRSIDGKPEVSQVSSVCKQHVSGSDDFWRCFIQHFAMTSYHPAGTCAMGSEDESTTVVLPNLKVKGIEGLRVVDASIMPYITSGSIQAPVIMIAEFGAHLIFDEHQKHLP